MAMCCCCSLEKNSGSGKTTFVQQLNARLHGRKQPPYIVNLDPAVKHVPFDRNIDIRDSVNYREVMAQYNLGPNGGIVTSLNLFATKMDQVMGILERRAAAGSISRVLIDTPGQIECFVWSASGAIITDALASAFPTVLAYIIDTPRTAKPATFMANMLYACSILYKTKLPMVLVFNKTDVHDAAFAREWMTDFEAFQRALRANEQPGAGGGGEDALGGSGYMSSLLNSMSLVLDEFYSHLDVVAVSATRDIGIDDFLEAVDAKVLEYERDYRPEMERARARRDQDKQNQQQRELDRLMKDMHVHKDPKAKKAGKGDDDDGDDDDVNVVSDIESSSGDDGDAHGLVDRDEDEQDAMDQDEDADDDAADDETLRQRYEKRFAESAGGNSGRGVDKKETRAGLESLDRYLRTTNQ